MQKRLPKDFNIQKPEKEITDPDGAEREAQGIPTETSYLKHLVKPLPEPGDWHTRELVIAKDEADEKRYRAAGYMTHQEADVIERKGKAHKS